MRRVLAGMLLLAAFCGAQPVGAEPELPPAQRLDALFAELKTADAARVQEIEQDIAAIWNDAGSPSMNLLFQRAQEAMATGESVAAITHLNDLVRLAPDFAEGWNLRATVHYYTGAYRKSLADIRETLLREPRHYGALSGLGLVFLKMGDAKSALEAYRAALELHPHLEGPREMARELAERLDGSEI